MGLGKFQRNEIFRAVEAAGLSPEEFDWDIGADESRLQHRSSGAYFVFAGVAGNYTTRYVAGDAPLEEREGLSRFRLMQQLGFWLVALKVDIDTPDLWAQLRGEAELLGAISDEATENTPFTPVEQEEIARQLEELRDYVTRTYSLSEAQTRLLKHRLNYLAAAASRVGRKDWVLMAAGVILGYVLPVALPPEAAADILRTLITSIGQVLGYGPPGLPGG